VQALFTARILFNTINVMTLKEGILYKVAIIIMMMIAQISLTDSSAKKSITHWNRLMNFRPRPRSAVRENELDITLHLELLIGKPLSMLVGHFKKNPMLAISVDPIPLKCEPSVPSVVKSYVAELALFKSLYTDSTEDRDPNAILLLKQEPF